MQFKLEVSNDQILAISEISQCLEYDFLKEAHKNYSQTKKL